MLKSWKIVSAIVGFIVILICGFLLWRTIYDKPPKPDPIAVEIEEIKKEVIKERIIIREVVRDAQQEAIIRVNALSDDVVADEWNERLRQYNNRTIRNNLN